MTRLLMPPTTPDNSLKGKLNQYLESTNNKTDPNELYSSFWSHVYCAIHYTFINLLLAIAYENTPITERLPETLRQACLFFLASKKEGDTLDHIKHWEEFDDYVQTPLFATIKEFLLKESKIDRDLIDPDTGGKLDYPIEYEATNQSESINAMRIFLEKITYSKQRSKQAKRDTSNASLLFDCFLDHLLYDALDGKKLIVARLLKRIEEHESMGRRKRDLSVDVEHFKKLGIDLKTLLLNPSCLNEIGVPAFSDTTKEFIPLQRYLTKQDNRGYYWLTVPRQCCIDFSCSFIIPDLCIVITDSDQSRFPDTIRIHPSELYLINLPIDKIKPPKGYAIKGIIDSETFTHLYAERSQHEDLTTIDFTRYRFTNRISLDNFKTDAFSAKSALYLLQHAIRKVPKEWYVIPMDPRYRVFVPDPSLLTKHQSSAAHFSLDFREVFLPSLPIARKLLLNKGAPDSMIAPRIYYPYEDTDPMLQWRKQGYHIIDKDTWWQIYLRGIPQETLHSCYKFYQTSPDHVMTCFIENALDFRNKHPEAIMSIPPRGKDHIPLGLDKHFRDSLTRHYPTEISHAWSIFLNIITLGGLHRYLSKKHAQYSWLGRIRFTQLLQRLPADIRHEISLSLRPFTQRPIRPFARKLLKERLKNVPEYQAMTPMEQDILTGKPSDDIPPDRLFKEMFLIIITFGLYRITLNNREEKHRRNVQRRKEVLIPQMPDYCREEITKVLSEFDDRPITQPARDYLHYQFGGLPEFQALSEEDQAILFGKLPEDPQTYFHSMKHLPVFRTHRNLQLFVNACYKSNHNEHITRLTKALQSLTPWSEQTPETDKQQKALAKQNGKITELLTEIFKHANKNIGWRKQLAVYLLETENHGFLSLLATVYNYIQTAIIPGRRAYQHHYKMLQPLSHINVVVSSRIKHGPAGGGYWNHIAPESMENIIKTFPTLMRVVHHKVKAKERQQAREARRAHRRLGVITARKVVSCTRSQEARVS